EAFPLRYPKNELMTAFFLVVIAAIILRLPRGSGHAAPIRRARTAPLDPSTVPEQAQLLGSFDCMIIDNAATAQLRPEQLEAIQVWVGTGGLLIEVGGATWQSTLGPLPPDLLPVEPSGLTNLQTLSALGDFMDTP